MAYYTIGLFFLAKLLAWFIFSLFLSNMRRKRRKMYHARTLEEKTKKNRSNIIPIVNDP